MTAPNRTEMWHQVRPEAETGPCGRDIWGNSFVHNGSLYLFGGAWERYGHSRHQRDHGRLGTGDDLWRYDLQSEGWTLLEADRWSLEFGPRSDRPGSRLLGSFSVVGDYAYLFGGLNCFMGPHQAGYSLPLNDLWRCDLAL